jgi:hypothetical protein
MYGRDSRCRIQVFILQPHDLPAAAGDLRARAWVKEANFEAAETLDKSYITEHFKETESDLL